VGVIERSRAVIWSSASKRSQLCSARFSMRLVWIAGGRLGRTGGART
jgi:hypothetical protein